MDEPITSFGSGVSYFQFLVYIKMFLKQHLVVGNLVLFFCVILSAYIDFRHAVTSTRQVAEQLYIPARDFHLLLQLYGISCQLRLLSKNYWGWVFLNMKILIKK